MLRGADPRSLDALHASLLSYLGRDAVFRTMKPKKRIAAVARRLSAMLGAPRAGG